MKKKVLIIGLINNFGGREIEVRNIIEALIKNYDIRVFSLLNMSSDSMAVKDLHCSSSNVFKEIYRSNLMIKIFSNLSRAYNNSTQPNYYFVDNKLSGFFFSLEDKKRHIVRTEISNADIVMFNGVLESSLLNEIISYCDKISKPIIIRSTGEIKLINDCLMSLLPKVSSILIHSKSYLSKFITSSNSNIVFLDQTTLMETELLHIPIYNRNEITYGYLGRFSSEKGIIELVNIFKKVHAKLIIAGSGPLLQNVKNSMSGNCIFLGEISQKGIVDFFDQIDVLIIPSLEEAGPLVGIEAMAAGKIIFSTRVGAMEERMKSTKNDFWFDIHAESTFLDLVIRLQSLTPEEILEIRLLNRLKYQNYFSRNIISDQYLRVLDKVFTS